MKNYRVGKKNLQTIPTTFNLIQMLADNTKTVKTLYDDKIEC